MSSMFDRRKKDKWKKIKGPVNGRCLEGGVVVGVVCSPMFWLAGCLPIDGVGYRPCVLAGCFIVYCSWQFIFYYCSKGCAVCMCGASQWSFLLPPLLNKDCSALLTSAGCCWSGAYHVWQCCCVGHCSPLVQHAGCNVPGPPLSVQQRSFSRRQRCVAQPQGW